MNLNAEEISELMDAVLLFIRYIIFIIICLLLFLGFIKLPHVQRKLKKFSHYRGLKLAKSKDPNVLRNVSKWYEKNYEVIMEMLGNRTTPADIITYWIIEGAWHFGLREVSFYGGRMDENMRERILCRCVIHPNVNVQILTKVANDILNNKKDYYIEHAYPEDDLMLIYNLALNEKLPIELRAKLKEYARWRKVHGKRNTICDENGFIKRKYL